VESVVVKAPVVIVGAGLGGIRLAENLRNGGYAGALTLVGEEQHPPYDRPPLSKTVLTGDDDRVDLKPSEFFGEHDIELRTGSRVVAVDPTAHTVTVEGDGATEQVAYGTLVLATGLVARQFPGTEGVGGVHVIRTVEDARRCVSIVRAESPQTGGIHGVHMRRSVGYVQDVGNAAFVQSLEDAVVALMIEKKTAVENLEEILEVKGVDMVQFGPADYSMSLGIPGQWSDPRVWEAQKLTIETALKMGVAPRAEIGSVDQAKRFLDLGVKHFCIGTDVVVLSQWWKKSGDDLRKLVETA